MHVSLTITDKKRTPMHHTTKEDDITFSAIMLHEQHQIPPVFFGEQSQGFF